MSSGSQSKGWNVIPGDWIRLGQIIRRLARLAIPKLRSDITAVEASVTAVTQDIDFEIPLLRDVTWSTPAGAPTWVGGTIFYKGTEYTIADGNGTSDTRGVYINDITAMSSPVTLTPTDTPVWNNTYPNRWYVAFFNGTTLYPALQSPIMHAGLLQANTVLAAAINTTDLFVTNDVTIGDPTGTGGLKWDAGATTLALKGSLTITNPSSINTGDLTHTADWTNDSTANTAVTNAATAQGTANTAVTNAATAQGTADSASSAAATNLSKLNDWSHVTQTTKIDGGKIWTGTILADAINTTDLLVNNDVIIGNYAGGKGIFWDQDPGTLDIKGDVTANTLTAKTALYIGKDLVDAGDGQITGTAGGVLSSTYTSSSSNNQTIIYIDGTGLHAFTRSGAGNWPTGDGSIDGTLATGDAVGTNYKILQIGGSQFSYAVSATTIHAAGYVISPIINCDPTDTSSSDPSVVHGGLFYDDTEEALKVGVRDPVTAEWRKIFMESDAANNTLACTFVNASSTVTGGGIVGTAINAHPVKSAANAYTGNIAYENDSGTYYIWAYINGAWRRSPAFTTP